MKKIKRNFKKSLKKIPQKNQVQILNKVNLKVFPKSKRTNNRKNMKNQPNQKYCKP